MSHRSRAKEMFLINVGSRLSLWMDNVLVMGIKI